MRGWGAFFGRGDCHLRHASGGPHEKRQCGAYDPVHGRTLSDAALAINFQRFCSERLYGFSCTPGASNEALRRILQSRITDGKEHSAEPFTLSSQRFEKTPKTARSA